MKLSPEQPATNRVFPYAVKVICAPNKQVFLETMLKVKRIKNFIY